MLVSIEYCNVVNNNQPLDIQQKKYMCHMSLQMRKPYPRDMQIS